MPGAIELNGLTKSFGEVLAVDDVHAAALPGQVTALLGPNGAGKTTTLRMVTGLLRPDAGEVRVFGIDARADAAAAKGLIAWVPDEPLLPLAPDELPLLLLDPLLPDPLPLVEPLEFADAPPVPDDELVLALLPLAAPPRPPAPPLPPPVALLAPASRST